MEEKKCVGKRKSQNWEKLMETVFLVLEKGYDAEVKKRPDGTITVHEIRKHKVM